MRFVNLLKTCNHIKAKINIFEFLYNFFNNLIIYYLNLSFLFNNKLLKIILKFLNIKISNIYNISYLFIINNNDRIKYREFFVHNHYMK